METRQLISQSKPLVAVTPTAGAAAATDITGLTIDLQDFPGGVLFMALFGAIVAGAATSLRLQHGDLADNSDMADIAGSSQTVLDTDDDKAFYLELAKPLKRYARLIVKRATQNATVAAAALPYGSWQSPLTQVASGKSLNNPVSGTA